MKRLLLAMIGMLIFTSIVLAREEELELVGRWTFGPAQSVCVQNNLAYLCAGGRLVILDVSNPKNPLVQGQVDVGGIGYDITVTGHYAYIANQKGLVIVDVGISQKPILVGFCYASRGIAYSVAVFRDYAFLTLGEEGIEVIRITDPAHPQGVGIHQTDGLAYRITISENYAYFTTLGFWGNKLCIWDLGNPGQPQEVGSVNTFGDPRSVWVVGNYAYLAIWDEGLLVIDVSNPRSPRRVGSCAVKEKVEGVFAEGQYAFLALWYGGLRIVDVQNPRQPKEIGSCSLPQNSLMVRVEDPFIYVVNGVEGLAVINAASPAEPKRIGFYDTPGLVYDLWGKDHYLYAADWGGGLWAVDITKPYRPQEISFCNLGGWGSKVSGNDDYAYAIAGPGSDLWIVDLSDPRHLRSISCIDLPNLGYALKTRGNYVYLLTQGGGFYIIDFSNPREANLVGFCQLSAEGLALDLSTTYAFIACGEQGLRVVDLSNPKNPQEIGSLKVQGTGRDILVNQNYAYVASGGKGVRIIDVSDPYHLRERGFCMGNDVRGVALAGHYLYIADRGDQALRCLDINLPTEPHLAASSSLTGFPEKVWILGQYVCVAAGFGGISIFKTQDFIPPLPPQCALELKKNDQKINEIEVEEGFDIYVQTSSDIQAVRFLSDDDPDGQPSGNWTPWYSWKYSKDNWNTETKSKGWTFSTVGKKEIWVDVKDQNELMGRALATIFATTEFTFVQITDVHIGDNTLPSYEWTEEEAYTNFTNVLKNIGMLQPRPAFVLVTGDIVEYARSEWFKIFQTLIRDFTKDYAIPVYFVPGNHDRREGEADFGQGDNLQIYKECLKSPGQIEDQGNLFVHFSYRGYSFIGLDSGFDTLGLDPDLSGPEGNGVSTSQIEYLQKENPAAVKILFLHHPIIRKSPEGQCENGTITHHRKELLDYCEDYNVKAVLAGHLHWSYTLDYRGTYFWTTPSATKGKYGFRLVEVQGEEIKSKVIFVEPPKPLKEDLPQEVLPLANILQQNYPNPFSGDTIIPYALTKRAEVRLQIYAANGGLVRELNLGEKPAGFYFSQERAASWDGRSEQGEQMVSGIYFYVLQGGDFSKTRKMVLLRR